MPSEHDKGRAYQLITEAEGMKTHMELLGWLVRAVMFLLVRYCRDE